MISDKLLTIKTAAELLGITTITLKRYSEKTIKPILTEGGHRRYRFSDIQKLKGEKVSNKDNNNIVCCYVRVSSHDQKKNGDLERQKSRVLQYAIEHKYQIDYIFEEVGSGLNDNRYKLNKLFELVINKDICKVIVEHKDRLTRFNYKVYETFFKSYNVEIEVIEEELNKSFEDELVKDMISLMSSFSARIYGKRSHRNKVKNENTKKQ